MAENNIFARIVRGEIPCHKVWEDAGHLAFLDIRPVKPGHTLVIPKADGDYLFDLEKSRMGNPEGHRARGGATPRSSAAGGTAPRTATGT